MGGFRYKNSLDIALGKSVARAIVQLKPEIFTLENVRSYVKSTAWEIIKSELIREGYSVYGQIIKLMYRWQRE